MKYCLTILFLLGTFSARAQMQHEGTMSHHMHSMTSQDHKKKDLVTEVFMHINHTMHEGMNIDFTGDPDIDFLKGMIPHHQGAVDMALVQLAHGKDGAIKSLSQGVIRSQNIEIGIMQRKLKSLEQQWNGERVPMSVLAWKRINHKMHQGMSIDFSGQADIDFVKGMIPHHQGAVDMANLVLEHGKDTTVKRLAREIIDAQVEEINMMNVWLRRLSHRNLIK